MLAVACIVVAMVVPASLVTVNAAPAVPTATPSRPAGPPLVAAGVPAGASQYVAVAPLRVADTRTGVGFTNVSSDTISVSITNRVGVPSNATAAVLNVTIAGSSAWSYVTVYPGATGLPNTSSLNADGAGRVIANMVHVKIGTNGAVNIFRSAPMGLVVDLVGVYVPVTAPVKGGRLVTNAAGAVRVLDTRGGRPINATETYSVNVAGAGVPTTASAVVVTLTAVDADAGFWSAFPSNQNFSGTSTLNLDKWPQTRAAQAIVNLDGTNRFKVYAEKGGNLLVDVVGYFTGSSDGNPATTDGLFLPTAPMRMFDSRMLRTLTPWSGSTFEFYPGDAGGQVVAAAVLNITATSPWAPGYVTAYPAGVSRPNSSNLNVSSAPQTIANHAIVRISAGRGVALYTYGGTHLIADVAGWYLGIPSTASTPKPPNPVYNANPAIAVSVPKIGVYVGVRSGGGSLDAIADAGFAATWSDINTVAASGNLMLFGHRTHGSAPFRYLDAMSLGDEFIVIGSDGHQYHYEVMHIGVSTPSYSQIQAMANPYGPITAQLVACSKLNGTATSTAYRLVVTGRLVSVT
ncbi:MAG TPA: sortase [Ilumatobacteraceae bacterium]|nr:sortase [Ilumatobacteraceae bacterium]